LKLLSTIVQTCGKLRGGALISGLYGFLHNGDTKMSDTVQKLLTTVSKPLYLMILKWVLDGSLEDPYAEFFIASDNTVQVFL
jgi:gamma-tubulin complex component 3